MDDLLDGNHETHDRTIIHIDMDYYYAQVEEILNPILKTKPMGVQQRNSVVTSNYAARKFGIKKMMTIAEAKKLCPQLVLVNGEDLTKYKQMSAKIFDILLKYTPLVEKLGLDENYLDVSEIVKQRLNEYIRDANEIGIEGCIYPKDASLHDCDCGCSKRLEIATHIAKDIRKELYDTLGITCCAGIAHNKFLAKLVGGMNKPNNQTVLVATAVESFMRDLGSVKKITGVGVKTEILLNEIGIINIADLQNCDIDVLRKKLGSESANKLKDLSFGRDNTPVRTTGKPKSIGLEDSCRPISVRKDIEERFRLLLMRLVNQVSEDGRIPVTIKVVLRKYDANKKTSYRETKQANISPSFFKYYQNQIVLAEGAQDKLIKIIMKLFDRVIDMTKPFNITLLGLTFSKFQERKHGPSSIANFLIKKTDLDVQSVINLKSEGTTEFLSDEPADDFYRRRTAAASVPEPVPMDLIESVSDISDFSETEIEPSPKKTRLGLLIAKRRCISSNDNTSDIASPSKLRVADLRLNSRDSEKDMMVVNGNVANDDCQVTIRGNDNHDNKSNGIPLHSKDTHENSNSSVGENKPPTSTTTTSTTTINGNLANIPFPAGVDPSVFKELPVDVQNELLSSWRNSLAAKANGTNTNLSSTAATTTASGAAPNTLYRYFIKNN